MDSDPDAAEVPADRRVFISYRRSSGAFLARSIQLHLKAENYGVFLDVDEVNSGRFENVILNRLGSSNHVLVVLTPATVAAMRSPEDWVRREVKRGFELEKNLVPIFGDGVRPADLPATGEDVLGRLRRLNGLTVAPEYFDQAMRTLVERFLQQPTLQELRFQTAEERYSNSVSARERGDLDAAEAQLTEAIGLNPGRPDYYQNRAAVRVMRNDLSGALSDINQALGLDSTSQHLAIDRFHIYQAMGDLETGLSSYRQWARSNGQWTDDLSGWA